MSWYNEWKYCKKILCVRLDNIGDIILLTPALRALKKKFPGIHITLLTSSVGAQAVSLIPDIDSTLVYNAPWIENPKVFGSFLDTNIIIERIRKKNFDAAILFTNFSQNPLPAALLLYIAGIKKVLGYSRETPGDLISFWIPDTEPFSYPDHGVLRQLKLLKHIGIKIESTSLSLSIKKNIKKIVIRKLQRKGVNVEKDFIVLHAGVSLSRRKYPKTLYIQAARKIISDLHLQIILTGNEAEKHEVDSIQKNIGKYSFSLAGDLTLEEFVTVIKLAKIVVSNNTSAIHVAAAMETPVVVLYARSNPEHTPWKIPNRVLYFDIPDKSKTKNTILLSTIPKQSYPLPQPIHIVNAVQELLTNQQTPCLPKEMLFWDFENK